MMVETIKDLSRKGCKLVQSPTNQLRNFVMTEKS